MPYKIKYNRLLSQHFGLSSLLLLLGMAFSNQGTALEYGVFGNFTIRENSESDFSSNPYSPALDFYIANEFNQNLSGLFEFVAEKTKGHTSHHTERLSLKYQFNDLFELSGGRFHTPIGYWNRNYHHGRLLHDTVERPFFLEFEHQPSTSSVVPVHATGLMLSGKNTTATGSWGYEITIANAMTIDSSGSSSHHSGYVHKPELGTGDFLEYDNVVYNARFTYSPQDSNNHFGLFALEQTIQEDGDLAAGSLVNNDDDLLKQLIYGIEAHYEIDLWSLTAELFQFENKDISNHNKSSASAYYIQAGYALSNRSKLTYRHSSLDFKQDDIYFDLLLAQEQKHHIISYRYDINEFHTIKAEIDYQDNISPHHDNIQFYRLQWAFLFL